MWRKLREGGKIQLCQQRDCRHFDGSVRVSLATCDHVKSTTVQQKAFEDRIPPRPHSADTEIQHTEQAVPVRHSARQPAISPPGFSAAA